MKNQTMKKKYQRGISLLWSAVGMGLLSLVAVLGLLSWRYERNLFGEALDKMGASAHAKTVQKTVNQVRSDDAPIRKCVIDGKTVYSNVECKAGNKVDVRDSQGFEAPKVPEPPKEEKAGTPMEKMMQKL